ncbi:hypothetical protein N9E02_01300 [Ilumatobacteraceae bacterium]|jgi:hypothetical protein|nr:hypothetical protein [Ilumatobacteraceae bacterium]
MWGLLMILIGGWIALSAQKKSTNGIYRLLEARARVLWKDNVHRFLSFSGAAIAVVGILLAVA